MRTKITRQKLLYNNSGGLSKREQETMIHFNEAGDEAMVYTFNASLKRGLAELALKCPSLCRMTRSTTEGGVTYMVDRTHLSVKILPPPKGGQAASAHGSLHECSKPRRKSA